MNIDLYITFLHNYLKFNKKIINYCVINDNNEIILNTVTHLTFSYRFNQVLKEGIIPKSVTHLTLGWCFNQELIYIIT